MRIFELDIPKLKYSEFLEEIQAFLIHNPSPLRGASFTTKGSLTKEGIPRGKSIFTPNPEICLATLEDSEFLEVLKNADYLTSDGIGLYLWYQINDFKGASLLLCRRVGWVLLFPYFLFNIIFRKKFIYERYWDRICGSDLTQDLVKFAEKNNIQIAVLDPYFPQDKEKCLSQKYFTTRMNHIFPHLKLDFYIYKPGDEQDIFDKIKNSDAQVLFSTLGMKRQEISVLEALKSCPNLRLWLWVGSSFDYFTGFQKRAPKIWRTLGFEWLYRIFTSPGKWKRLQRIFRAVGVFPAKILFDKTQKKN